MTPKTQTRYEKYHKGRHLHITGVPKKLKWAVEAEAFQKGMTVSSFLRAMVRGYMAQVGR